MPIRSSMHTISKGPCSVFSELNSPTSVYGKGPWRRRRLPVLCHITDAITLNDFRTAIHLIVFLLEGTVTCRGLLDGYDELDVVWGSGQGPDISGVGASALAVAAHPELTV